MKSDFDFPIELIREETLIKAISDFSHIAEIKYKKKKNKYIISIKKCVCENELAEKELRNYLIDLENVRG